MKKYMREPELMEAIMETALGQYQGGKKEFTCYKMARWIGRARSSKLQAVLNKLVQKGLLSVKVKPHRGSVKKYVYKMTNDALMYSWIL